MLLTICLWTYFASFCLVGTTFLIHNIEHKRIITTKSVIADVFATVCPFWNTVTAVVILIVLFKL